VIYEIRHVTAYAYASAVPFARHVLRLRPVDRMGVTVESCKIEVDPAPTERSDERDFFGNGTTQIALDMPHEGLVLKLTARLAVEAQAVPAPEETPDFRTVRRLAAADPGLDPMAPVQFLFPSRLVGVPSAIRDYAAESFPAETPILAGAIDLMRRIYEDFVYEPGVTDARTLPLMAFEMRRGVCQDFAHVMIAGLRGLGLPAAYVGGYLRTVPPPGKPRLEGADAMHAWVAVWCGPEAGWIGLDPTNAVPAGDDHIVVAIGRDYADVAPVSGIILGSGSQRLDVAVDVIPVEPEAPESGAEQGSVNPES